MKSQFWSYSKKIKLDEKHSGQYTSHPPFGCIFPMEKASTCLAVTAFTIVHQNIWLTLLVLTCHFPGDCWYIYTSHPPFGCIFPMVKASTCSAVTAFIPLYTKIPDWPSWFSLVSCQDIADINTQFPVLARDISIPDFVPQDRLFSSVLRLGSPGVQLWTHYDVMDNVLLQVKGHKRAVLFSPQDATYLYLNGRFQIYAKAIARF